jgi:hypothetical protein
MGQQAGGYNTGLLITAIGNQAAEGISGNTNAGSYGTYVGAYAGQEINTGQENTFLGYASGKQITTGAKNTIIGSFQGNSGGLDIRTGSKQIILSDGDGDVSLRLSNGYALRTAATSQMLSIAQTWDSSVDYDDLKWPGMFRVDNNATNAPTNSYHSVVVFGNGDNVTTQIAVQLATTNTYLRSFNQSWSSWVRLDT